MTLRHKTRKRLALLVLLVGLPIYIVSAVTILNMMERASNAIEFLVYVALGIFWILPLKSIFLGIGQDDPGAADRDPQD